jgi:hypothetical protein
MSADRFEGKPAGPSGEEESAACGPVRDSARLIRIVRDFNLARTNAALYPPDHPLIAESLDRVYEALGGGAASGPALTLVATKGGLISGGERLDPRNAAYREFAAALGDRNILSLTFDPGLARDDLLLLHRVLNMSAEEVAAQGGVAEAARKLGLSRIVVREVDYSRFRATDGAGDGASSDAGERSDQLWERFVDRVLAEDKILGPRGGEPDERPPSDPARLARFINDDPENASAALRNYGTLLTEDEGHPPDPLVLERMGDLLRRLNPELKRRLLAMTFEEWKDREDVAWDGLGGDLVAEMLEQAGRDELRIPPALTRLVNALSAKEDFAPGGKSGAVPVPPPSGDLGQARDNLKTLFTEKDSARYVDPEYGEMLDRLSRSPGAAEAAPAAPDSGDPDGASRHGWRESLAADLRAALDPAAVLIGLCDLLNALLEGPLDPEEVAAFACAMAGKAPALVAAGEYMRLARALRSLEGRIAGPDSPLARDVRAALRPFHEPSFAASAVRPFLAGAGSLGEAADFFDALGAPAVTELVDLYVGGGVSGGGARLIELLSKLGGKMSEEIARRLADADPAVVRRALRLCMKFGGMKLPAIRPLLGHPDDLVRTDALAVLLDGHDAAASEELLRALGSSVERESASAVRLAGRYRRAEAVPALLDMITVRMLRKPDVPRNLEIIRTLGRIGDPAALPRLRVLARRRNPLFPAERRNLRQAIYESLDGYPLDGLAGMLADGHRAGEHRIRVICQSLQRRGASPARASGPSGGGGAS